MTRVTRMGIGLIALIPVLGVAGSLLVAAGAGAESAAWIVLGVGLAGIVLMTWWALRAPPARSDEVSARYWAGLRHARFGPQRDADDEAA